MHTFSKLVWILRYQDTPWSVSDTFYFYGIYTYIQLIIGDKTVSQIRPQNNAILALSFKD